MKNKLFFTTCLMFMLSIKVFGQNPGKILAPKYHSVNGYQNLQTNNTTNPLYGMIGYQGQAATASQNIQMDASGQNIMFFIVDDKVFGRNGEPIGELMNGGMNGAANGIIGEMAIIPSDICSNEYYIFGTMVGTTSVEYGRGFWDKITVSYDFAGNLIGGSGLMSQGVLPLDPFTFESLIGSNYPANNNNHDERPLIASTKLLSNGKRFIYISNGSKIFRLKIQNGALSYDNYFVDLMSVAPHVANNLATVVRQEMELVTLSNGNLRLALPVEAPQGQPTGIGYLTLDFASSTGNYISNSSKTILYTFSTPSNKVAIKGAELSPNGNRLYLTHQSVSAYPSTVDMFDLTNANPFSTRTVLSTNSIYKDSQIETGGQGILLFPTQNNLMSISNANNPTLPATFNVYANHSSPLSCPYPPRFPLYFNNPVCLAMILKF